MARAPALQAGGRRFDSDYLHKRFDHLIGPFFVFHTRVSLTTPLLNIPSRVTEVYMLYFSPMNLICIPPFFICMKVPMYASHFCLLWPLFRIPSEFISSKFTERCVILGKNGVQICHYSFFKRSFDYARYSMCNLISHYLILSPGRCSVQSCPLNPRHRFSGEKWCVAAQFQMISQYTCRDTPISLIFHVSRARLIPFH